MARLRMTLRLAVVIAMVFQVSAAPAPSPDPAPLDDDRPEIIEIIAPAEVAQETLDSLNLGEPNSEQGERNKRTIGILREMFPSLSKIIDQKIQQIVSFLFRTVGRSLLSGAIGGGRGSSTSSTSSSNQGGKVSISLPTYGPDSDDDDSDEDDDDSAPDQSSPSVQSRFSADEDSTTESTADNEVQASNLEASERSSSGVANATTPSSQSSDSEPSESDSSETNSESITTEAGSSPAPTPDSELSSSTESFSSTEISSSELADLTDPPTTLSSTSSSSASAESDPSVTSDGAPEADLTDTPPSTATPATSGVNAEENLLSEAESQQSEVRVQFAEPEGEKTVENKDDASSDQESAASGVNGAAIDDLSLDDADGSDENRNKRFLNFGFGDSSSSGSGSGGGSGNFLFDIIRRPAESMARAAGQAFRILTGTDSIGLGITATHTAVRDLPNLNNATKLVAGSGGTEQTDEASSGAADGDSAKGDTYTEGIPGPVTRLFIIANRGISNLIQDLILRLAQTSERIVNFKARLITSII